MPNNKNTAKQACPMLEDQKQAEFSLKKEFRKTAGGTLGHGQITPWVMERNETIALQNPHISHDEHHPGLHASSLGLAESIGGALLGVHSQAAASQSPWINTKQEVSEEKSSSHATSAGLHSFRFPCLTIIHSAPTSQFLDMKNCQVATQVQISGDTETVYTGSAEYQRCLDNGGMQNLELQSHDDTQSALYNQMLDQNSWIIDKLESSRQQLGRLSIKQSGGAKTPSGEPFGLTNYSDGRNCMHQEMRNGSKEAVTSKNGPVGNQTSGIQPTTQDLQGIYENYGNSSSHNIGKVQRDPRLRHSVDPYSKMTKKARELLKKKEIQDQLDFVDKFHGICPKLVYIPAFSTIQENENMTPPSPTWPGK